MKRWISRLLFPTVWCLEHVLHWSYWRRHPRTLLRVTGIIKNELVPHLLKYNCSTSMLTDTTT
ncbi:MAG: hypothetical protein CLLPBCKN_000349 [Chroococcidiopsis cubana SAG 39.79]|nr:hypothetical protein [Chroococcidiopsis cubana SAG 39.79]